ncbi:MAG TPA: flagellar basal body P-ring formation protein FlgA, partial [Bacteroidetes bacterium]|nr:flagellar basal body P-ring formation protein FlgA [Bacteroidota bacterium]HEX04995.1 flagellar basal body P-ring formation protein FlgA [Bacteroidota bacterium]
ASSSLRSAIDEYVTAEWGEGNVEWVELSMPAEKLFNGSTWTLEGSEKPRGRVVLYLNVLYGNTVLRRIPFRIQVMPFAWTPVVAQPLQRNSPITSENIRWDKREVTEIRHTWPESPDEINNLNLRAKRSLSPGKVLLWQDVEIVPEVCQGDLVRLRLEKGTVVIETEGIALQDGREGEVIRVEQTELGTLLRVRVAGYKRADVINALGR